MPNPLHPDLMSADERLAEIARILARGLIRLKNQQSTHISAGRRETSLAILPDQSRHANRNSRRSR
jgi:hypothetical protein